MESFEKLIESTRYETYVYPEDHELAGQEYQVPVYTMVPEEVDLGKPAWLHISGSGETL